MIMSKMKRGLYIGILTVSDTCFTKEKEDKSGTNLASMIKAKKFAFCCGVDKVKKHIVPDEICDIQAVLKVWADEEMLDLILTVGGTGFSQRDVTPEATKGVLDREAQSLATAMILGCQTKTCYSVLSRSTCGVRGQTLILNLPGSVKGSQECLEQVSDVILHAMNQLKGNTTEISKVHQQIQSSGCGHQRSNVNVSKVAERPRKSTYPMISVNEAENIILKNSDVLGTEYKRFKDCLGYILAVRVVAEEHLPPFPASMKDGYAVIAADGKGIRKVLGSMPAGAHPLERAVVPGTCVRVSTGGAIPSCADSVIQVEDTELVKKNKEGTIELEVNILKIPTPGQDIRPVGSDIKKNQVLIPMNKCVTPAEIGLMAAAGIHQVLVYKKPDVAVLSTGNELMEPSESLKPGCIWDSNKISLLMMLQQQNFNAYDVGIAKDTPEEVKLCFEMAFSKADVVISTGGVSMGEKDIIKQVLEVDFGAIIHFARVFMKPGKPTTFATLDFQGKKKIIFGLPGNPVSAMVTFHLYVIPCLRKMMGYPDPKHIIIKAKLADDIELDLRPEYHRAALCWSSEALCPMAYSTGNQQSSRQLSMVSADALLILPPRNDHQAKLFAGAHVDALLLRWM